MPNQYVNKVVQRGGNTLIDISDTTAVASDVASGKYFYLATGEKVEGTGSGGGGTPVSKTGTVVGNGTNVLQIPCEFEPDLIRIYGDLSADVATRGVTLLTIIKDMDIYYGFDSSTSASRTDAGLIQNITGYNESDTSEIHATYSNNTLNIDTVLNSGSMRWPSGITYEYELIKFG